jgi:hypothetical protein
LAQGFSDAQVNLLLAISSAMRLFRKDNNIIAESFLEKLGFFHDSP